MISTCFLGALYTLLENLFIYTSLLQVLLLDEPTAGLDPFSRHQVWNLLKERKIDHVILFSTQFMDEADILAGNCRFPFSIMMKTL